MTSDVRKQGRQKVIRGILEKATVAIRCGESGLPNGTGWLFSCRGYILTAGHVLKNAPTDPVLLDDCNVCFGWDNAKTDKNIWLKAKRCACIHREDLMLDYAVLKISERDMPNGCRPLPIWTGDWPYGIGCSVLGYHAGEKKLVFLISVQVTGDSGKECLRLENQSLVEGFSGSAIFAMRKEALGVFAVQVAKYRTENSGRGEEVDTRYALPIRRIIENWPPFEDLLNTSGIPISETNASLIAAMSSGDPSIIRAPSHEKMQRSIKRAGERISALTKGEVHEDLLRCTLLKRLGGLPAAQDTCLVGMLFLWLTAEMKRSKTVIARLRKVHALIQAILQDAHIHYELLHGRNYNAVVYDALKSIASNIDKLREEFGSPIYDNPDPREKGLDKDARLRRYLTVRTGLAENQVGGFISSLSVVKNVLSSIPSRFDPTSSKYRRRGWDDFLKAKSDGLWKPLETLFGFFHIQKGLENTLKGLIEDTRDYLRDAFAVVDEIVDGKKKDARLTRGIPLETVVLDAILNLPQNSTGQRPSLRAWPKDISAPMGVAG